MPAQRLPWYKVWADHVEHGKMAELSDSEYRTWHHVLAKASTQPDRWTFTSVRHAAFSSGRPEADVARLLEVGLLDQVENGVAIHNAAKATR